MNITNNRASISDKIGDRKTGLDAFDIIFIDKELVVERKPDIENCMVRSLYFDDIGNKVRPEHKDKGLQSMGLFRFASLRCGNLNHLTGLLF